MSGQQTQIGLSERHRLESQYWRASSGTIVNLSAEQNRKWQETITPLVQEWTKTTPDGVKVLSTYRGLLQKVRVGG